MSKDILKRLSLVAIILIALISMVVVESMGLTISNDGSTSVNNLIDLTQNENEWYGFTPEDVLGKKIGVSTNLYKKGGYCVDPHTAREQTGNKYSIVNVFDVNVREGKIDVYDDKGNHYEKDVNTTDESYKKIIALSYLCMKADQDPTNVSQGSYKNTIWRIFNTKSWINGLAGLSPNFVTGQFSNNYISDKNIQKKLTEAMAYANNVSSGYNGSQRLELNMTDTGRNSVEIRSEKYLGIYNISYKNIDGIKEAKLYLKNRRSS
jgi:hypothetical protein